MNAAPPPETGPDGASSTQMSPATAGRADDTLSPPNAGSDGLHADWSSADRIRDSTLGEIAKRAREVARIEPSDLGDLAAIVNACLTGRACAKGEVVHIFFRLPIDAGQSVDLKLDAHLFSGLAPRRILRRLVSFAAAAGELPVELAIAVLHEKNPPVAVEDDARGAQHQAAEGPGDLRSRTAARIDCAARVRRRSATHRFLPAAAIGPPRSTRHRIGVALLDERVHAGEEHGKQRCHDRPPQSEHEQADTPAQATTHRLCRDPGLNDR